MTSRQLITAETAAQPAVQASRAVQEDGSVIEQVDAPPADASGVAAKLTQFATSAGAKQVTYAVTDVWFPDLIRDLRKTYGAERVVLLGATGSIGTVMMGWAAFDKASLESAGQAVIICIRHISNCAALVVTDDSPEKIARKLAVVTAGDESPLAESGGYAVGDLKKFMGATHTKADDYCQRMIADGCTVELIVGGLSVTGNNAALEEMYGPGNTAMIWGTATTGNNLFTTAKKHRHAIVLVTNPTSWNACFAATPDSAEKVIRKLTTRSSKDAVDESVDLPETLCPVVELARIPGNLDYGANQLLSGLHKAGANIKLASMPSDVTTYQFKQSAAKVYGKEQAPTVLFMKDAGFNQSIKGKTVWAFLTYHPPHDTYVSAVILTDDSLDKIMRKISAAQTVQEAGQAVEIDYPPYSALSSVTHMLGDLWAVNSQVKFGLTGLTTNQCADKLSRVYGAENVEITLDRLDSITRRDPRAASFVLRATGKQVWMLFAADYSSVCVSVISDDDFGKIMRKIAVAGSVSESKPILKKVKTKVRDVNKDQLKIGRKVEREHTNNPTTATKIALAHLGEDPKYYDKLDKAGLIDEADAPRLNLDEPASAAELEIVASAYTPRMRADLRCVFSVAKSVRVVGRDSISSSVIQAARAAYGREATVVAVIYGYVDASVIGNFTGKDVVVMVARDARTGIVRTWSPLVLMVTRDPAEKIDRTITKWLSVKESLPAPDQITEGFIMTPTTWAATVRPLTAKLRAELDDIVFRVGKVSYLGVAGGSGRDILHQADEIYGDDNVALLSLTVWAGGGFLERVEDKNIVVISDLSPMWPTMVVIITDDSPDKIARKFAAQDAQMESAQLTESIKLTPVGAKTDRFAHDPITDALMQLREVGAKLSFVRVSGASQYIAWGAVTGIAMTAGYDVGQANYMHQPSEQFILDCAGQNVVVAYRVTSPAPDGLRPAPPLYVTFIRTDDPPEKIERALNRALTVAESAIIPDPTKA